MSNNSVETAKKQQKGVDKLQGRLDLDVSVDNIDTDQQLQGATLIPEDVTLVPLDQEQQKVGGEEENHTTKTSKHSRFWPTAVLAILLLAGIELGMFIYELIQQPDLLAGLWLAVISAIGIVTLRQIAKEWLGLRKLKLQQSDRNAALQLYESPAIGQGEQFCCRLAQHLPHHLAQNVNQWQQQLQPHFNDRETIALFEKTVVAKSDKAALSRVTSHASAASAMIAVSPFALLDMLIVLWRNIKMLNEISESYGIKLSYWARIRLIRNVFKTMLYAGASEIIADAGSYALGAGITGKLSARLAQGLSAGVLTARIGIKAMDECRPLPWLTEQRPGINSVSSELLTMLKSKVN